MIYYGGGSGGNWADFDEDLIRRRAANAKKRREAREALKAAEQKSIEDKLEDMVKAPGRRRIKVSDG